MNSHAELVAAVDDQRLEVAHSAREMRAHNAHLDTLAAILNLHHQVGAYLPIGQLDGDCAVCHHWPCETVGIVIDALRKMGAL